MELVDEGNMYYMDFTMDENPEIMFFNDSNHSVSVQDKSIQEKSIQENHSVEESEETEKPVYKLNNIDTEASIKSEIKQLILIKISEEITSSTVNDMTYEAEEQISNLRDKTDCMENKIQELDKEVETDESRLAQIEEILMKTDEMISLLKENIEKLMLRYRESRINELSEKSAQQLEKLGLLKIFYQTQINKEKEDLKNKEAAGIEHNIVLKSELTQKDEILKILIQKQDDLKKVASYDDEMKNLAKKQSLELKLKAITNKRATLENEFMKQKDVFSSLRLKGVDINKIHELTEGKTAMEQQLDTASHELEKAKTVLAENENHISQKKMELKELKENLKTVEDRQETLDKFQQDYNNTCHQLNMISTNIVTCNAINDNLLMEVNALNAKYLEKCEAKLEMMNKFFVKRNDIMQKLKIDLFKKEMEIEVERTKYEELQNQYEKSIELIRSLENDTAKERENDYNELMQLKSKFEAAQAEHNKDLLEIKKKKEYLLTNSKFLEEKADNLKHERIEIAKSVKNLEEENASLKVLIEKKLNQLSERKITLNALKKGQNEVPLKSGLKSPHKENTLKKVQFNEILSFKSASSSEVSNLPVGNVGKLETSLHEWLGEDQSNLLEKIDEEF